MSASHLPVIPTALSPLLRSTHLVLVRLQEVEELPSRADEAGVAHPRVMLTLRLEEVFKGSLHPRSKEPVQIEVIHYSAHTPSAARMPGAWSYLVLKPEREFVVWAYSASDQLEKILLAKDPLTDGVEKAEAVLPDIRLALEFHHLELPAILKLAKEKGPVLGPWLAGYLWDRESDRLPQNAGAYEALVGFLERAGLATSARAQMLTAADEWVSSHAGHSNRHVSRLVIALFRILRSVEDTHLQEHVMSSHLPRLLGLNSPLPHRSAAEIFHDFPAEQQRARKTLQRRKGAGVERLRRWLG
jgi:hypothetical protein